MLCRSWHNDSREGNLSVPMKDVEGQSIFLIRGLRQCVFCPIKVCPPLPGHVQTKADQSIKYELVEVVWSSWQFCVIAKMSHSLPNWNQENFFSIISLIGREQISGHNADIQNDQESECLGSHLGNGNPGFYFYLKPCSTGTEMKIPTGYSFTFTYLVLIFHPIH